ncbi:helix-turn-helix transcriptional regulator [Staphylococcus nepalensis]
MIRNRLSELLSERGLRTSRVAKETQLARSSLTATINNDSEMIRLETINKLCNYLKISPNEFFEYSPINIEYEFLLNDFTLLPVENTFWKSEISLGDFFDNVEIDFIVDIKNSYNNKNIQCDFNVVLDRSISVSKGVCNYFNITNENDYYSANQFLNELSAGLRNTVYRRIENDFKKFIENYLVEELNKVNQDYYQKAQFLDRDNIYILESELFKEF